MPRGIFPRTKEYCQKLSESAKRVGSGTYVKTEEHKKKLSLANMGNIPTNKGIPMTVEQRLKMSLKKIGRRPHNWKGGLETLKKRRKVYSANRRINGKVSIKVVQLVYEDNIKKYGTLTCYLCEKSIEFGKDELEHKIPICRGGTNLYENLEIACKSCNSSKRNKTVEEFIGGINGKI